MQHGADIEARNIYETTPIGTACANGHKDFALAMAEIGADPTTKNRYVSGLCVCVCCVTTIQPNHVSIGLTFSNPFRASPHWTLQGRKWGTREWRS